MKFKTHIVYWFIIIIAVSAVRQKESGRYGNIVRNDTDTVLVEKIDTVVLTNIVEKEVVVVDTIYLRPEDNGFAAVPISKYRFKQDGLYDISARGFNVSLDGVTVFPKVEYRTVTNTITKEVVISKWDFYAGLNLSAFNREMIPSIIMTAKTPQRWLFGASIGLFDGGPIYGVNVQYKLNK